MKKIFSLLAASACLLAFTGCSQTVDTPPLAGRVAWITTPIGDVECIVVSPLTAIGGNRAEPNSMTSVMHGSTDCKWGTLTDKGSQTPDDFKEFKGTMIEEVNGTQTFCIVNYSYRSRSTTDCNWK